VRLAQKLTLAFVLAVCGVLAANGTARVRREVALFETHAIREHRSVGRALRSSVLAVFRTEGEQRALELVEDATRSHGRIRFQWVWFAAARQLHGSAAMIWSAPEGHPLTVEASDESGAATRFTYVRATAPDGRKAALELAESLADEKLYVRKTIFEAATTTLALIIACAVTAMIASAWFVGRPIRALVDKARRMGEADFSGPLSIHARDELGVLGAEMNVTCERLIAARDRIRDETAAKIAAVEQLRHAERLSTLGQLASGIAHELGTPINIISGRADMIVTGEVEGEAVIDSARVIAQTADRLAKIVRQFLDYARRRGPQRAEVDLCKIATQSVELLKPIAQKKGANIAIRAGVEVRVNVDLGQLQQAITNVVMNALQAMSDGGRVDIECGVDGERAFVRVRDNGPGISEGNLKKIFDPFFTTKTTGEGTGLGLSIVQDILADHGGSVDVTSREHEGTTFTLWIPGS
jgi:two-component system, NtrC family, sensor kinase